MSLQIKQSLQQRLMLAPNMTLALQILRMPNLELQAYIQQQVEENPLLDLSEDNTSGEQENGAEEPRLDGQPSEDGAAPESETSQVDAALPNDDDDLPWLQASRQERNGQDDEQDGFAQWATKPPSLYDALLLQLGCQNLSPELHAIAELIIHHINEHGYLEASVEELSALAGIPAEQTAEALKIVQAFDPPGVAARDIRECLLLQLERGGHQATLAYDIVLRHFPLFLQHKVPALARALRRTPDQVEQAFSFIKRLNPRPGRGYATDVAQSVVPDLVIHRREQHYDVELNDRHMPGVAINRSYYRMLRSPGTAPEVRTFLQQKFRHASWVIKAIDERNATLLAIARCLISLQRDFLEQGPQGLKPLTQAQVAGLIGRHPSTVSRAISGKTIDTPFGVFALDRFFATALPQAESAKPVSDALIREEIQRLVSEESRNRPLSDEAIVRELKSREITVARRTIAKYRSQLKILPAHLRRRHISSN